MRDNEFKEITDYSVAPYNFVPLPEKSIDVIEKEHLIPHNVLSEKYMSGYIEYDMINYTPLVVGKGNIDNSNRVVEPLIIDNKYVIPGNTIRGVLRNNASILSLSDISDDIEDKKLYYRSFGKDKAKDDYRDRLDIRQKMLKNKEKINAPCNIFAGYIYKESNRKYVLIPVSKDMDPTYYSISEQYLRKNNSILDSKNYMYSDKIDELIKNKDKYKGNNKKADKRKLLRSIRNKDYKIYCRKVSFQADGRTIKRIGELGEYSRYGYILSSQHIDGKLAHYIIPTDKLDEKNKIVFDDDNYRFIDYYNDDLLTTKKYKIKGNSNIVPSKDSYEFYGLPDKEGIENGKPIFYGRFNDQYCLGFTPYLRIPYDYSIKDGISENYKNGNISYVDAIFGFINKKNIKNFNNYKSRISVEDCVSITNANKNLDENEPIILSEPHPSSVQLYLKQDSKNPKELRNYNNEGFRIRGIKQYWIREEINKSSINNKNKKIETRLKAIPKQTKFKGRINYENLTEDELGLILWAIKVTPEAHENIGMGKPYGYGNVEFTNIKVYKENIEKKYSSMSNDFYEEIDREEYIEKYKNRFDLDIDKQECYKEFVTLKTNIIKKKDKDDFRYMRIGNGKNEFSEKLPLLKASEQIKKVNNSNKTQDNNKSNRTQYNKKYRNNSISNKLNIDDNTMKKLKDMGLL